MPANGYMQAPTMDHTLKEQALRQFEARVEQTKLADRILLVVTSEGERQSLVARADTAFMHQWMHRGMNFAAILTHLAGFPLEN